MRNNVKCACGGSLVAVWDVEEGLTRVKCGNPYHGRGGGSRGEAKPRKSVRAGQRVPLMTREGLRRVSDAVFDLDREGL